MKVPYREGIANHSGPESCATLGNRRSEALTGGNTGRVLSLENFWTGSADPVLPRGRQHYDKAKNASLVRHPRGQRPRACVDTQQTGIVIARRATSVIPTKVRLDKGITQKQARTPLGSRTEA